MYPSLHPLGTVVLRRLRLGQSSDSKRERTEKRHNFLDVFTSVRLWGGKKCIFRHALQKKILYSYFKKLKTIWWAHRKLFAVEPHPTPEIKFRFWDTSWIGRGV